MTDLGKLFHLADRAATTAFTVVAEALDYGPAETPDKIDPEKETAVMDTMILVAIITISKILPTFPDRKARKEVLANIVKQANQFYQTMNDVNLRRAELKSPSIITPNTTSGETDA